MTDSPTESGEYALSIDVWVDDHGEYMLLIESSDWADAFAGEHGLHWEVFTDLVARD